MRKSYIIGFIALVGIIISFAWAEQITLTTYYPSPYGVYKQTETSISRLVPSIDAPDFISDQEEEGMLYFDDGTNRTKGLYYWDSSVGDWVGLGGGPAGGGLQVVRNTDISTPADGSEALMAGMRIAYKTSSNHSLLVMFSAPIAREPTYSGVQDAYIRIYIDGAVRAEQFVRTAQDKDTMVYQLNLRWGEGLDGGEDHTVEIKWQGSGIEQPGATCAGRVLTILPIGGIGGGL